MRGVWARAEQQRSEGCILDTGYGGKWTTLGEFTSFSSLVLTPDPNIGKPTCPLSFLVASADTFKRARLQMQVYRCSSTFLRTVQDHSAQPTN